nr:DHHA1 domain-containing protein [Actinomycetota bacterium]
PFYAESGGQLGDTGTIATETGAAQVVDTTYALPGLQRHLALVTHGHLTAGQTATAGIDAERREAIRRNHTGTHILHWALREVLGQHVKQAGSLVAPDRLRFDFSHYGPLTPDELAAVEDAANAEVLGNQPVRAYETTQEEALRLGAIAFFGEKYGDVVRVVEAGRRSVELCGGTHVGALGTIGPIKIVSEGSIGSNLRRIEAVTGKGSLQRIREEEQILGRAATLLRVPPPDVPERVEHVLDENRELSERVKALRRRQAADTARSLAMGAADGVIVARVDGASRQDLQDLAVAVRDQPGVRAVVLGSVPDAGGVALVAAVAKDGGLVASDLIAEAARTVGGGGGKSAEIAVAGGRDPSRLDEALDQARRATAAT